MPHFATLRQYQTLVIHVYLHFLLFKLCGMTNDLRNDLQVLSIITIFSSPRPHMPNISKLFLTCP